jgi:hypothetical protein
VTKKPVDQLSRSPRLRAALLLLVALWTTGASPAILTRCDVNVLDAYLTAKGRGWAFRCGGGSIAVIATFATYPPNKIGCQFKTPPVWCCNKLLGQGYLFDGSATSKTLKNGWVLYDYEVTGVPSWQKEAISYHILADFSARGSTAGHTHHAKLATLTLSKPNGVCADAIDEAF